MTTDEVLAKTRGKTLRVVALGLPDEAVFETRDDDESVFLRAVLFDLLTEREVSAKVSVAD